MCIRDRYEICCEVGEYTALANGLDAYENQNVEAVFDSNGKDITANVPLYTAQTKDYEGTEGYEMYLKFTTNGNSGDACMGDKAYYGAPVQNTVCLLYTSDVYKRQGIYCSHILVSGLTGFSSFG